MGPSLVTWRRASWGWPAAPLFLSRVNARIPSRFYENVALNHRVHILQFSEFYLMSAMSRASVHLCCHPILFG